MIFIDLIDIIGTAAFAISGALVGIKKRLDIFGIYIIALVTATGGGLMRDVIISKDLPVFFTQPHYIIIISISTLITLFTYNYIDRIYYLIKVFDAAGLGVFTVLAAYKGIQYNVPVIGIIFMALMTGIGGGIIRDILVNDVPLVFSSEIYATASLVGAVCFYFLYKYLEVNLAVYICIFFIFVFRMLAIQFDLRLPVIKFKEAK